jgi:RNA polymerase sigma-70 factor (ECF subfamily)
MTPTENVCTQKESALPLDRVVVVRAEAEAQNAPPESAVEAEWRARLSSGDMDVLPLLYDHYAPGLYRVLAAILGANTDAEDALQEIFVRLAQGRAKRVHSLRAYLFTAARNEARTLLRRRGRECAWEAADSQAQAANHTDATEMQSLLLRLPVEQREVIAMKIYEEMTFAEIAKAVGASPNTVASRYRYGIERLRGWLQEEDADATHR